MYINNICKNFGWS